MKTYIALVVFIYICPYSIQGGGLEEGNKEAIPLEDLVAYPVADGSNKVVFSTANSKHKECANKAIHPRFTQGGNKLGCDNHDRMVKCLRAAKADEEIITEFHKDFNKETKNSCGESDLQFVESGSDVVMSNPILRLLIAISLRIFAKMFIF